MLVTGAGFGTEDTGAGMLVVAPHFSPMRRELASISSSVVGSTSACFFNRTLGRSSSSRGGNSVTPLPPSPVVAPELPASERRHSAPLHSPAPPGVALGR